MQPIEAPSPDSKPPTNHSSGPISDVYDVVIFGAGIAGMTAAHELLARNFKVLVVDKDHAVGGVAKSQPAYVFRNEWGPTRDAASKVAPPRFVRALPQPHQLPRVKWDFKADQPDVYSFSRLKDSLIEFWLKEPKRVDVIPYYASDQSDAYSRLERLVTQLKAAVTPHIPSHLFDLLNRNVPAQLRAEYDGCFDFTCQFELPGEHGFRFFPSYYDNLFDTMQRTPLVSDSDIGSKTADEPGHSVYDNLSPTKDLGIGLVGTERSFTIKRSLPRSLDAIRAFVRDLQEKLGFSLRDMIRMETKLFLYATSCADRRKKYEKISWFQFVDGDAYSEKVSTYLQSSSQALGALRATECDARTYGNTVLQLLTDQLTDGSHSDSTLAGPTTESWFAHWKHFLQREGVQFLKGTLKGFEEAEGRLLPIVDDWSIKTTPLCSQL